MLNVRDALCLTRSQENEIRRYMPTDEEVRAIAGFFAVYSDPTRVKILSALSIGDMCVSDIACLIRLNQSTVSHQLKLLRDCGMVRARRDGKVIYYAVADPAVEAALSTGTDYIAYSSRQTLYKRA